MNANVSSARLSREAGRSLPTLFVVGCPRSGTTWIQLLLAQHSDVVTSQETHVFLAYVGHLMKIWERDLRLPPDRRRVGLTAVLRPEEFRAACLAFTDAVLAPIRATSPDARLLVEKTPGHVLHAREILRLYPDASFLHVIRDPRGVVCSLRNAGRSWGRHWAPTNVADGAHYWRERVEAGLEIAGLTPRYHEVRYEELQRDAASVLAGACEFLGLPAEPGFCERAAQTCRLERLQGRERRTAESSPAATSPWQLGGEPDGFFGSGQVRGWRDELTRSELRRVEHAASPLMAGLGYEPVVGPGKRRPLRTVLRDGLEWRHESLHRTVRGWLQRL